MGGGRASWGDNDRSQLENKAKVKIMTTAFMGGGEFLLLQKNSVLRVFFVLFCFFFPNYTFVVK